MGVSILIFYYSHFCLCFSSSVLCPYIRSLISFYLDFLLVYKEIKSIMCQEHNMKQLECVFLHADFILQYILCQDHLINSACCNLKFSGHCQQFCVYARYDCMVTYKQKNLRTCLSFTLFMQWIWALGTIGQMFKPCII